MDTKNIFRTARDFSTVTEMALEDLDEERYKKKDTKAKDYYNTRLARFLVRQEDSPEQILDLRTLSITAYNCKVDPDNLGNLPFIKIEPILEFVKELKREKALTEAKRVENIYLFLLSCRRMRTLRWQNKAIDLIIPFYEDID